LERKQAQDKAISAHAAALTDKTRVAALVDRLSVLSKEHDRSFICCFQVLFLSSSLLVSPALRFDILFIHLKPHQPRPLCFSPLKPHHNAVTDTFFCFAFRLSDSRDRIKNIVDSLTDKVSDAKQRADNLQQSIQDVKYEEHDKLEAARMGY
jgi:hypothetical protein